ncbi:reverse transcriptase domain-containing protein [Tanacetum coccineum]
MMYLAAADEAVSTVLLTETDGRQIPIHYVSISLQGAETNYALMEKLTLSQVYVARRLRRYFHAHSIKLEEYDIQYVPRVAVKGQILANFLADTSMEINVAPVRLYTDGASNSVGFGAGIILIALDDVEYSNALCLNFSNSNNDTKYKALLAGLLIATKMQVKDIHAFVNSKLVASQVEGSYKAKGERMIKYQEKVLELAGAFNRCRITHIPRAEYRKADAISKLAVVQFNHLSKEVLVEVLNERSIKAQEVNMVLEEEGLTWMTPIRNYQKKGV